VTGPARERQPVGSAAVPHTPIVGAPLPDRSEHRTDAAAVTADLHAAESLAEARVRRDLAALAEALDTADGAER